MFKPQRAQRRQSRRRMRWKYRAHRHRCRQLWAKVRTARLLIVLARSALIRQSWVRESYGGPGWDAKFRSARYSESGGICDHERGGSAWIKRRWGHTDCHVTWRSWKSHLYDAVLMKKLSSNTDLYNYLLSLGELLAERGSPQLAESVRFASRRGTGLSTEFLGESRIALRRVLDTESGALQMHERDELRGVISQVEPSLCR